VEEDRVLEYCEEYYDRLNRCLIKDNLLEELLFVRLGIELGLRTKEITLLTWDQIDFNEGIVGKIKISKKNIAYPDEDFYYDDEQVTTFTLSELKELYKHTNKTDKVFNSNYLKYIENIRTSIGDRQFNGHMLRYFSAVFRARVYEDIISKLNSVDSINPVSVEDIEIPMEKAMKDFLI
jgi:integrase